MKIRTYLGSFKKELTTKELEKLKQDHLLNLLEKEIKTINLYDTDFKIENFFTSENKNIFSKSENLLFKKLKKNFGKIKKNEILFIKKEEEFIISHSYDSTKAEGSTLTNSKFEGKPRLKGVNVSMGKSEFKYVSGGKMVINCLNELILSFNKNYNKDKFSSIVKFYSGFIAIHPFIDGNGRTSRILLNYLILRENLPPINFNSEEHGIHIDYLAKSILGNHIQLGKYILENLIKSIFLK
jgi:hypothetical protein